MTDEELSDLHEVKVLLLIRDIYSEENKLRELSADDRYIKRQSNVRPRVDSLFKYIHLLAESEERFSARMEKAIQYAINQENRLREFLNDGHIPCYNGTARERSAPTVSEEPTGFLLIL